MAWTLNPAALLLLRCSAVCVLLTPSSLPAQQSNFTGALLAPAASRVPPPASHPTIAETEKLPYLSQLEKNMRESRRPAFTANASDLLVGQAEEKFRSGR